MSQQASTSFPQSRTALDGRIYVCLTYDELDILDAVTRVKSPSAGAVVMFAGTTRNTFADKRVSHLSYTAYAPRALATMVQICTDILLGEEHGGVARASNSSNITNNNDETNCAETKRNSSNSNLRSSATSSTTTNAIPTAMSTSAASTTIRQASPDPQHTPLSTGLLKITLIHRLGPVPINSESIIIAVSGAHRQEAWRAGEEALERCKEKVEVWKEEWLFEDEEGEGAGELREAGTEDEKKEKKELVGVWRANRDGKMGVKMG